MRAFSVELQNSPGSLAKLTEAIAERGINVTNVVGATCGGSGSLGIITNDESSTRSVLDGGSSGYRAPSNRSTTSWSSLSKGALAARPLEPPLASRE